MASGFGLLALLLACLGVYGTLAYAVARRTSEIGLRMALGAARGNVVAMILRESLAPVAVGVAAGVAGARPPSDSSEPALRRRPRDAARSRRRRSRSSPRAIAAWLPARRASSVDPMTALRCE